MTYILSASERALRRSGAVPASSWYWREVKADWRRPSSHETYEAQAIRYARWLAARDGVSLASPGYPYTVEKIFVSWEYGATGKRTAWNGEEVDRYGRTFVRSVEFVWRSRDHGRRRCAGRKGRGFLYEVVNETVTVATIQIPNHDRVCGLIGAWTVDDACNYIPMEVAA